MAVHKRGETSPETLALLDRRRRVASAYLRGLAQWEIARGEGVDQATVSRDLAAVRKEWLASAVRDFDAARSQELAKLDHLERTYWEAWQKSCAEREIRHGKTRTGDRPSQESGLRKEGRDGNPEFLKGVERCVEGRCKLLGLVVTKVAPVTPDGQGEYRGSLRGLTDDQLDTLDGLLAALGAAEPADPPGGGGGALPA